MPLKIVNASEDDIPEMMRIDNEAHHGSMAVRVFYPNGRSKELLRLQGEDSLKQVREDASVRNIKVIDTDYDDEAIAFARWHFYFGENVRYINTDVHSTSGLVGADPAGSALWNETVRSKRIEHIGGTPHCCQKTLSPRTESG